MVGKCTHMLPVTIVESAVSLPSLRCVRLKLSPLHGSLVSIPAYASSSFVVNARPRLNYACTRPCRSAASDIKRGALARCQTDRKCTFKRTSVSLATPCQHTPLFLLRPLLLRAITSRTNRPPREVHTYGNAAAVTTNYYSPRP